MNLEVGLVLEGKVVKLKPFGAIILLGSNIFGLVHISHVSNTYVQDINEHIAVGDIVSVKVLSVDAATNKVALSMKDVADEELNNVKPMLNSTPKEKPRVTANSTFEEKYKDWVRSSNERMAGINKRNKRR